MTQETIHTDWDKLKNSYRFKVHDRQIGGSRFDHERWDRNTLLRQRVQQSEPFRRNLPVYYPGSGSDIVYPLVTTDASEFVFVDYLYVNDWETPGMNAMGFLIDQDLPEIGARITSDNLVGVLGQKGKRVVKFDWTGKERGLTLYAEDATKFTPKELQDGVLSAIVKAPTPVGRNTEDKGPGPLYAPAFQIKMYHQVVIGGFINWKPVDYLQPEMAGFEATNPDEEHPSYQKIRDVPKIESVVKMDNLLMTSISLRDGIAAYSISRDSVNWFKRGMRQLRRVYMMLDGESQSAILPLLQSHLAPNEVSLDYLDNLALLGKDHEIDTRDKALDYVRESIGIFLNNFPELQA